MNNTRIKMKSLFRKTAVSAGLVLAAALVSAPALASPVTWTLDQVTFADGGTASGWFTWDAQAWNDDQQKWGVYGDFSIQTSAATGLGWLYTSTDGHNMGWHIDMWGIPASLSWAADTWDTPWIDFQFMAALPDAGGTVAVNAGWECSDLDNNFCRQITGGSVTAALVGSVPEPGSLALVGAALFGITVVTRNKKAPRPLRAAI